MSYKYTVGAMLKIRKRMKGLQAMKTRTNFSKTWEKMEKLGFCNYRRKRGGKRTKQVTNQVLNKSFSEVEKNNLKV